nr:uncharacterized protein LOC129529136 isoform X2 [Gorilla gorilla gorilla]
MWEGFFQDPGRTLQSWEFFNFPFLAVTPGALSDGNMQVNQWMVALPNKMIERNKGTVNGVTWLEYGSNYKACSALARRQPT